MGWNKNLFPAQNKNTVSKWLRKKNAFPKAVFYCKNYNRLSVGF